MHGNAAARVSNVVIATEPSAPAIEPSAPVSQQSVATIPRQNNDVAPVNPTAPELDGNVS